MNAFKDAVTLISVFALAILPLVVVLPVAPPMRDDTPVAKPRRPLFCGWRITLTITR